MALRWKASLENEPSTWSWPGSSGHPDWGPKRTRNRMDFSEAPEPRRDGERGWGRRGRGATCRELGARGRSLSACAGRGPELLGVKGSGRPRGAGREPRARACYRPHSGVQRPAAQAGAAVPPRDRQQRGESPELTAPRSARPSPPLSCPLSSPQDAGPPLKPHRSPPSRAAGAGRRRRCPFKTSLL